MPHGCGQMRVVYQSSCRVFSPVRTKCSLNWLMRTTTPRQRRGHICHSRKNRIRKASLKRGWSTVKRLFKEREKWKTTPYSSALNNAEPAIDAHEDKRTIDRKSTRLNSSHLVISYAVFC